jgi:tetratricopeptide (TPR) repeat protein
MISIEKMIPNNKKHKIALLMIVKNESHIIARTLDMLHKKIAFDYWVISDTGSTDNTSTIVKETMDKLKVPGQLIHKDWIDFSTNRNHCIEIAESISDYMFFFDADDDIYGKPNIPNNLTAPAYSFIFGPNLTYRRNMLVKSDRIWRYEGVLHEYITTKTFSPSTIIEGDYWIIHGTLGNRSRNPKKYEDDAEILKNALEAEDCPKHLKGRYAFYCAQSYRNCVNYEKAIQYYELCLKSNTWLQEKYIACIEIAKIYVKLSDKPNALIWYLHGSKYDNRRVESIIGIIRCIEDDCSSELKHSILKSIHLHNYYDLDKDHLLFAASIDYNVYYINMLLHSCSKVCDFETGAEALAIQLDRCKNIQTTHLRDSLINFVWFCSRTNNKTLRESYIRNRSTLVKMGVDAALIQKSDNIISSTDLSFVASPFPSVQSTRDPNTK